MGTQFKDIIHLDFDADLLAGFKELSVDPTISDLLDLSNSLRNETLESSLAEEKRLNLGLDGDKGDIVKCDSFGGNAQKNSNLNRGNISSCENIKKEESDIFPNNFSFDSRYSKDRESVVLKNKKGCNVGMQNFVKTEPLSETDDEVEYSQTIQERGPDRPRRRSRRTHCFANRENHIIGIPPQRLLHQSSGCIVEIDSLKTPPPTQNLVPNSNLVHSFYCPVNSPESGYGGSNSSSPPILETLSIDPLEKEGIQKIVDQFKELEKSLNSTNMQSENCNGLVGAESIFNVPVNLVGCNNCTKQINELPNMSSEKFANELRDYNYFDFNSLEELFNDEITLENTENFNSEREISCPQTEIVSNFIPDWMSCTESRCNENTLQTCQNYNCTTTLFQSTNTPPTVQRRLAYKLGTAAKSKLQESSLFDKEKFENEARQLFKVIRCKQNALKSGEKLQIIDFDGKETTEDMHQTNLHRAVLDSNIERIYSLVEFQKMYELPLFAINIKDNNRKTALDYAIQKKMPLVIDYLKENTAVQGIG